MAGLTVLGLVLGYFMPRANQGSSAVIHATPTAQNEQAADLGITFLPLTPGLADYYNLRVKTGAFITEVAPNSLADRGGLRSGDVILSYNGVAIESASSLLGAIRNCPAGNNIVMKVSRAKTTETISFVHENLR